VSATKKFKGWYKDRCGHPLGVNLGMKAVNELEQENADLREALHSNELLITYITENLSTKEFEKVETKIVEVSLNNLKLLNK